MFREMKKLLRRCAETALNSKLVARHKEFFSKMVCEAVMHLDELLPLNMIGVKKVQGGALEVILLALVSSKYNHPMCNHTLELFLKS